jgi:hypothetical protein
MLRERARTASVRRANVAAPGAAGGEYFEAKRERPPRSAWRGIVDATSPSL